MARTQGSHSAHTGPKVRTAAERLFARHGYAAVSMRQIAAEVGVQVGALYVYTPDKQSLLFEMMKSHLEGLIAALPQVSGDPLRRLEEFTRFHVRYHLDRPEPVFIAYMELRNLNAENFSVIEDLRGRYEAFLETILRQGVEAGDMSVEDSKVATLAIIAMLTGITTWFRDDGRLTRAEVEEIYWDMVRRMVGA